MNWHEAAKGLLENEQRTRPLMKPPAQGCLVHWRGITKVGAVQWPVDSKYPAVVFLSVTSKYDIPEFVRAIKNLDPNRIELQADDAIDLIGNFHVLHREGLWLTSMTPEEAAAMKDSFDVLTIPPTAKGIHFEGILTRRRA